MAKLPRLVLPGLPYHVTQRAQTFFADGDYALYRARVEATGGQLVHLVNWPRNKNVCSGSGLDAAGPLGVESVQWATRSLHRDGARRAW